MMRDAEEHGRRKKKSTLRGANLLGDVIVHEEASSGNDPCQPDGSETGLSESWRGLDRSSRST